MGIIGQKNIQHFFPADIFSDHNVVQIAYYAQHPNGTYDFFLTTIRFPLNPRRSSTRRISTVSSTLPPTINQLISPPPDHLAINYIAGVFANYGPGDYINMAAQNGRMYLTWCDTRNLLTHFVHPLDPLSGQTHGDYMTYFHTLIAPNV